MIEIAGLWELGWSTPITEVELWRMALRSFGVTRLHMAPISGIADRFVCEHASMDAMLKSFEENKSTPVFVDEDGEIELSEFKHPPSVIYVFGKATYSPFAARAKSGVSVRIDCPKRGMLWPHQAMSIVLYDRIRKQ